MSAAATMPRASASGRSAVSSRMLGAAPAWRMVAQASGSCSGDVTRKRSMRSGRSPKAARKAAMAPMGFFRAAPEARLATATTSRTSAPTCSSARGMAVAGAPTVSGGGTRRSGVLPRTVAAACATKPDIAHTSWTRRAPARQAGDMVGSSQAQNPMTRRWPVRGPSRRNAQGTTDGSPHRTKGASAGTVGSATRPACHGTPRSTVQTATPVRCAAATRSLAASPRPEARESSPAITNPCRGGRGSATRGGTRHARARRATARRARGGRRRQRRCVSRKPSRSDVTLNDPPAIATMRDEPDLLLNRRPSGPVRINALLVAALLPGAPGLHCL